MWRFARLNEHLRTAFEGFCRLHTQKKPVKSITAILRHSNWKNLLDNSNLHKKLNPDVIRSVIHKNRAGDPKVLLDFLLWSEKKVGTLMGPDELSIIAVALCNSKFYGAGLDVIYRMVNTAEDMCSESDDVAVNMCYREFDEFSVAVAIDRCYREFDGSDPMVLEMLITCFREKGLLKTLAKSLGLSEYSVPTLLLCNLLLRDFLNSDNIVLFWKFFKRMSGMELTFDVYTYSIVINAYVRLENADGAKRVLLEMGEKGCRPDVVSYNTVIYGLCGAGRLDEAVEMKRSMIEDGLVPDNYTYSTLINGYCLERRLEDAKLVVLEMVDAGLKPDVVAYHSMIDGFIKQGNAEERRGSKKET